MIKQDPFWFVTNGYKGRKHVRFSVPNGDTDRRYRLRSCHQ
jgi:hypothetical protein